MKLLQCLNCGDVFNLQRRLKSCYCGEVAGKYDSERDAVVNGKGVSLAIGNGSLNQAMLEAANMKTDPREGLASPYDRHIGSFIAWARPHEGPANPHTKVVPGLKGGDRE